ncbi:hypothetical protein, partial [uncultured Tateyamaria sp.]
FFILDRHFHHAIHLNDRSEIPRPPLFETTGIFGDRNRPISDWCKLLRGLAHLADGKGSLSILPSDDEAYRLPTVARLNGPDIDDLPKLRDFLEGWQRLTKMAGTTAPASFTIDDAKNCLDAQMAVGLLLDPNPVF